MSTKIFLEKMMIALMRDVTVFVSMLEYPLLYFYFT
jgi:hypothetical protein